MTEDEDAAVSRLQSGAEILNERPSASAIERSRLVTGIAADGMFRWVATEVTDLARTAQLRLDLGPVASIGFGRCVAAATMLYRLTSKTPRRLVLDVRGNGPLSRILVEVGRGGDVRGLVGNPHATGPDGPNDLRLAEALGIGLLRVRREENRQSDAGDQDGPVTYESQVELVSSEIGSDVAYYLQQSEQRRCAIAVGVDVGPDGIRTAAGLLVEALPAANEEQVEALEQRFSQFGSVTQRVREAGLEKTAFAVVGESRTLDSMTLDYRCRCSEAAISTQLTALPAAELEALADDQGRVVAECAYCGAVYNLREDHLLRLIGGEN